MAQIIVSPEQMILFARSLAETAGEIRAKERALDAGLKSLGSTWADEKYRRFLKAHTDMSVQLQAFYRMSDLYVDFLGRKARAAERFLGH